MASLPNLTFFVAGTGDFPEFGIKAEGYSSTIPVSPVAFGLDVALQIGNAMSAAPEMLEASKRLLAYVDDLERSVRILGGSIIDPHDDKSFACEAIAKAECR